jgi:hypothetical protein
MIFTRLQVGAVAAVVGAIGLGLAWQVHGNVQVRANAARQSAISARAVAALEKQVAVQTRRVESAETEVAVLLKSAQRASATRPALPAESVHIDTDDAVKAVLARAKQLLNEGKQPEALDEYVKCYRELQAIRPGSSQCQSLMSAMQHLARSYPEARSALASLRDAAMQQLQMQPGQGELVVEIALLNERLDEGYRTVVLYDSLSPNDRNRQSLAMIANRSFIEARRYADVLVGKPFGQMLGALEGAAQAMGRPGVPQAALRTTAIEATLTNIEVLTGAGKLEEARLLTEKLLAFDSSDTTRAGLKQHLDRVRAPMP